MPSSIRPTADERYLMRPIRTDENIFSPPLLLESRFTQSEGRAPEAVGIGDDGDRAKNHGGAGEDGA